ncbi:uncharacterized protein METZ01_LOCUS124996, partial [marine metagenome]
MQLRHVEAHDVVKRIESEQPRRIISGSLFEAART